MKAQIKAISYYLPSRQYTNVDMGIDHPDWPIDKIEAKTGIVSRHIASRDEFSVDMGICATHKLLEEHDIAANEIDFILFCTQTPKHLIPTNACLIHEALNLDTRVGALDINQGCSGYVYSLMMAESLIVSGRAKNVLLVTADTYTKLIDENDRRLKPLFSDGATASLITRNDNEQSGIQAFEYGTCGDGAEKLISHDAGIKGLVSGQAYQPDLYMNGAAIFNFTLEVIPGLINDLLAKQNLAKADIDHFIFHQANEYMLEHLRQKMQIHSEQFIVDLAETGNAVSSSIPIVLAKQLSAGTIKPGDRIMLVGFGVGLSWCACTINF